MPAITICPLCRKSLVVPAGLDASARVRCPLCESEYSLRLVLGDVVEVPMPSADEAAGDAVALPPEFVPVAHVAGMIDTSVAEPDDVLATETSTDASAAESAETHAEGAAPQVLSSPDDADDGFTLAPSVMAGRSGGPDDVYAVSGHDDDPGFTLAHPDHDPGYHDPGYHHPADHAPHDVAHLDFLPGVGAGGAAGPPVSRALSDLRAQQQKSRPSHALAKFIGIAVAGALGVSLAYVAMSWANPAKFDFLHLWGRGKTSVPANGNAPARPHSEPTEAEEARWR